MPHLHSILVSASLKKAAPLPVETGKSGTQWLPLALAIKSRNFAGCAFVDFFHLLQAGRTLAGVVGGVRQARTEAQKNVAAHFGEVFADLGAFGRGDVVDTAARRTVFFHQLGLDELAQFVLHVGHILAVGDLLQILDGLWPLMHANDVEQGVFLTTERRVADCVDALGLPAQKRLVQPHDGVFQIGDGNAEFIDGQMPAVIFQRHLLRFGQRRREGRFCRLGSHVGQCNKADRAATAQAAMHQE